MGSDEVLDLQDPKDLVRYVKDSLVRLFPTKLMLEDLMQAVSPPPKDIDGYTRQLMQMARLSGQSQSGISQCDRRFHNFLRANKGIGGSLYSVANMNPLVTNAPVDDEKFARNLLRIREEMENVEVQREAASIDECYRARTPAFWAEYSALLTPEQKMIVEQEKEKNPALRSIIP